MPTEAAVAVPARAGVLLVDDHALLRTGVANIINQEPDLQVIAARTNDLPADFPGDPFDRTIIATAAVLNLTLVTTDPIIRDARACAVEYYPFKWRRPTIRRS